MPVIFRRLSVLLSVFSVSIPAPTLSVPTLAAPTLLVPALSFSSLFAVTSAHAEWQMDLPHGATEISDQVHQMHLNMLYWCIAIAVVVFSVMFYSLFRHRKSLGQAPAHFHENTVVEIIWTAIPLLILVVMAIPATKLLINMKDTRNADLTIKVTGSRWKWHYSYMDYQGNDSLKLDFFSALATPMSQILRPALASGLFPNGAAKDQYSPTKNYDTQTRDYLLEVDRPLVVPADAKVRLLITSEDVIHAWWMPAFAIKADAIPGFINELWFKVPGKNTGLYRGQCAELCGKDHGFMPIVVDVKPPQEFNQWLNDEQQKQQQRVLAEAESVDKKFTFEEQMAEGEKAFNSTCAACHQVTGKGMPPTFPPLAGSAIAQGPVETHINTVRFGKNVMPAFGKTLSPHTLSAIITYERNAWGNTPSDGVKLVQPADVTK